MYWYNRTDRYLYRWCSSPERVEAYLKWDIAEHVVSMVGHRQVSGEWEGLAHVTHMYVIIIMYRMHIHVGHFTCTMKPVYNDYVWATKKRSLDRGGLCMQVIIPLYNALLGPH